MSKKKNAGQAVRQGSMPAAGLPFWGWFLIGLGCGLLLALVAYWRGWLPAIKALDQPLPETVSAPRNNDDAELAAPPRADEKPKYDFYSVLPEMETVVPEEELAARNNSSESNTSSLIARYFLQAGSYRNLADADSAKANLALLGLRAGLQTVTINEVTWHRVRVGPFTSTTELDEARQVLSNNNIKAIALKESVSP